MSPVQLIGVPFDVGCRAETSQTIDSRHGPSALRKAYQDLVSGYSFSQHFQDLGDITAENTVDSVLQAVEQAVSKIIAQQKISVILGGAHTLTLGSLRVLKKIHPDYSLIYFDAHPDIMPHPDINYGSTIYYAIQEKVLDPSRIAYIGIRQVEEKEWELIRKHNIFYLTPDDLTRKGIIEVCDELKKKFPGKKYVSIDLDSLDPAFAPGVSCPYPFGMTPRELLFLAKELCAKKDLLGLEIVELAPKLDINNQTARLAMALLQELVGV